MQVPEKELQSSAYHPWASKDPWIIWSINHNGVLLPPSPHPAQHRIKHIFKNGRGFPGDSDGKKSACNAENPGLIPGSGRSPGEGNGYPLQYSCTPFPIWKQSVVPCPVLTVASWPAYRFLKRQVRWSGIPISLRIFHSLLWSTQYTPIKKVLLL